MPRLARITVYPIKSLDGVVVESATIAGIGGLQHDRRFALRDADGNFVNGKRHAPFILCAEFDLAASQVTLSAPDRAAATFRLAAGDAALEAWCYDYFGFPVTLDENTDTGFPDDLDSPGPTLIGTPTLQVVAGWFDGVDLAEARRRFRGELGNRFSRERRCGLRRLPAVLGRSTLRRRRRSGRARDSNFSHRRCDI